MSNRPNPASYASKSKTSDDSKSSDPMRLAFVRVLEALRPGEVTTYADVAAAAGYPRRHRAVGQLLSVSFDSLPWWRVVYRSGHLPPVNPGLQEQRLLDEGVKLVRLKVVDAPHGMFRKAGNAQPGR